MLPLLAAVIVGPYPQDTYSGRFYREVIRAARAAEYGRWRAEYDCRWASVMRRSELLRGVPPADREQLGCELLYEIDQLRKEYDARYGHTRAAVLWPTGLDGWGRRIDHTPTDTRPYWDRRLDRSRDR